MSTPTFTYHTDPGHGWIEVPLPIVAALGITTEISSFSYTDGRNAYLEEDCDAWLFVNAYEAAHGARPEFVEKYKEHTPIRNLAPFTSRITS